MLDVSSTKNTFLCEFNEREITLLIRFCIYSYYYPRSCEINGTNYRQIVAQSINYEREHLNTPPIVNSNL